MNETVEQVLTRQHARLEFRDGEVHYFSLVTQRNKAETIEGAITDIIEADKVTGGRSFMEYVVYIAEQRATIEENQFLKLDVNKQKEVGEFAAKLLQDFMRDQVLGAKREDR